MSDVFNHNIINRCPFTTYTYTFTAQTNFAIEIVPAVPVSVLSGLIKLKTTTNALAQHYNLFDVTLTAGNSRSNSSTFGPFKFKYNANCAIKTVTNTGISLRTFTIN